MVYRNYAVTARFWYRGMFYIHLTPCPQLPTVIQPQVSAYMCCSHSFTSLPRMDLCLYLLKVSFFVVLYIFIPLLDHSTTTKHPMQRGLSDCSHFQLDSYEVPILSPNRII